VFKKVSVLSGGEKSRLALVKLLLDPPNLLLMDEPTTHLDIASIDALVLAMKQFEGTLVFISHDVHFIRTLANKVIHVAGGRLTHYAGDYEFYLHKTRALSARAALTAGGATRKEQQAAARAAGKGAAPAPAGDADQQRRQQEHRQRQARTAELKQLKPLVQKLERELEALGARKAAITAELELPATWSDRTRATALDRELRAGDERAARLTAEWETAASRLLELDKA
jgi:ATP-binding cassette subfamily F protein 3